LQNIRDTFAQAELSKPKCETLTFAKAHIANAKSSEAAFTNATFAKAIFHIAKFAAGAKAEDRFLQQN